MTSTFTTNKSIEKPANGDYVNDWNVPVNADWDIIDKAFGGTTTLNATGQSSTPVNLTATQYQPLILNITGTLTANVTYTIPSGVGGQWIVANNTTGSYTTTIASLGGGTATAIGQGSITLIASDGTNIRQVGGNNIVGNLSVSGNITSGGSITASSSISTTSAFFTGSTSQGTINADNSWLYLRGPGILFQNGSGSTISYIDGSGNFTATSNVTAYSDANLKTDVTTIQNALSLVSKMRGVNYTRIDSGKRGVGVIAQEMQEVIPEVVHDTHGTLSVAYGNLVGVLIEAIKELSDKVEALESK
jgi:Chaperone of endosialidase